MSKYYDEDDAVDYEDDIPDFQDEDEFDDYLNDEEYELLNQIFPIAKSELQEYQGWDNLAVKKALFEHNFDITSAMIELKRKFKKKEPSAGKPLSTLEMLARKRAMLKQQQKSSAAVPTSGQNSSLLDALKKNKSTKIGVNGTTKQSLSERLQSLKLSSNGSSSHTINTSNNIATEVPHTTTRTLASKLASLRKAKPEAKKDDESSVLQESNKTGEPHKEQEKKETLESPQNAWSWKLLKELNNVASPKDALRVVDSPSLLLTSIIIQEETHQDTSLKRKHDELFTVYYPNTNKRTAKKQAISNFNKPSPDDVALTQQKAAFEVDHVKDNIANLSLQDKTETQNKHSNDNKHSNVSEKTEDGDESYDDDDDDKVKVEETPIRTYKKATVPTKPKNPIDIQSYLAGKKPHLNFVVLGHVDAGKSTLMGRLLYDVGAVDSKLIRKLQKESDLAGKSSFHLAWVMDQTAEERNRGVTVDICTSDFKTSKSTFTIVDAPGHRDFVPNAIVGISQADVAVLSVDCGTDAFESGFNLDGQTKEHALLARSLGIKHIIVAMNKMDTVGWYEGRFLDIKSELLIFFEEIGFGADSISWVPCSGLTGEGIFKTPYPIGQTWYKGPNLVQELEINAAKYSAINEEVIQEPFIFNILDVTPSSKNNSAVISGKVEAGCIQPGETITIFPSEQSCVVDSILCGNDNKKVDIAFRGDFVQIKLHNAFAEDIQSGDLASVAGCDIPSSQEFTCRLLTFKIDRPLLPGTSLILFRGATEQPCRIKKLCYTVDKKNPTKVLKKKVKHLGSFQSAIVELELVEKKRRIPMLTIKENKKLGRVVLRKEGKTVGAAVINSLDY